MGGEWPQEHPLPLPEWGSPREPYKLPSVEAYEDLALTVELTVQQLLQSNNYNTVCNFITFYRTYRRSLETNLSHFYRCYIPPITSEHHTCVGLGLELIEKLGRLEKRFPGLIDRLYIASCEELIPDVQCYIESDPDPSDSDKEHVLVAMRLDIAGRKGILLLDPGYHVARVVTVMEDKLYPHTGWFTQSKDENCTKEYNYVICEQNPGYVIWNIREKRGGAAEKLSQSIIYVAAPFNTPVDVTERRNLTYNFRSLLSRNAKGELISGVYFPVSPDGAGEFTLFYQNDDGVKKRSKIPFASFKSPNLLLTADQMHAIKMCNKQLGWVDGKLMAKLKMLNTILNDKDFVSQMLNINNNINELGQDI